MIFETANSIYEVWEPDKRFRRIHESGISSQRMPIGRWYRFQRMSPVVVGEPVRFFWLLGEDGGLSRIGLWATGPVVSILEDEEPSFLVPAQGGASRH
ncbi:MAG: hypothetical protein M3083_15465 [Actinomycetota bacterium]|nr:hypothetical protein [Actinomycetota bacterium]